MRPPSRRRTGISGSSSIRPRSLAASRGPAKRSSSPPLSSPLQQPLRLGLGQPGDIGQDDHIRVGRQHILQPAVDQFGHRLQGLPQIVGRRQQLQPLARSAPSATIATLRRFRLSSVRLTAPAVRCPASSNRVIRLRSSGGRVSARPRPRSRRRQRRSCPAPVRGRCPRGRGRRASTSASVATPPRSRRPRSAPRPRRTRRAQRQNRARRFERPSRRRAGPGSPTDRPGPDDRPRPTASSCQIARVQPVLPAGIVGQPRLRLQHRHPPRHDIRRLERHLLRRIGQPHHRHGPPSRPASATRSAARSTRRGQSRASAQPPSNRISRAASPASRCCRVQHRPGKAQDRRRNRRHAQQQQPPRRLVGLDGPRPADPAAAPRRETAAGSAPAARRATKATAPASATSAQSSQGGVKPKGQASHQVRPPARGKPTAAPTAPAGRCGGSGNASPTARARSASRALRSASRAR